jgi:hypothetical protein
LKKKTILGLSAGAVLLGTIGFFVVESQTGEPRSPASIPANYEELRACEKQEVLWDKAVASAHRELPAHSKFGIPQLIGMSVQEIGLKGTLHSDFSPPGWKKYLHRRGVLAKVKLVPRSLKYTGVFQGADCALLRLSLTYRPTGVRPVAPGLALKVLRDGVPSANVSALVSLEGQEKDFNFFKHPMSNIVPVSDGLGQKLVNRIFRRVSGYPEELAVNDMATVDALGKKTETVVSPRQIFFVPHPELKFSSEEHDVREDILEIPAGRTIYQVRILSEKFRDYDYSKYSASDVDAFVKDSEHVADLVTTSEFLASEFGDGGIFFRHELRAQ